MSRFDVGGPLSMSDVSSCRVGSDAVPICIQWYACDGCAHGVSQAIVFVFVDVVVDGETSQERCGDPWAVMWAGCVRGGTVIQEVEAFGFSDAGWVTGKGVAGVVPDPWDVHHPKAITQGLHLEVS